MPAPIPDNDEDRVLWHHFDPTSASMIHTVPPTNRWTRAQIQFIKHGDTTLTRLIQYREEIDVSWISFLINGGVNVNAIDGYDVTALEYAAHHGYSEIVEILLKHGATPNRRRTVAWSSWYTALHYAVMISNEYIVVLLLQYGANPNAQTRHGETPLMSAMISLLENKSIIRLLLRAGADPNLQTTQGSEVSPMRALIRRNRLDLMQIMVDESKFDVINVESYGRSLMMHAVSKPDTQPEAIEFLIKNGAKFQDDLLTVPTKPAIRDVLTRWSIQLSGIGTNRSRDIMFSIMSFLVEPLPTPS